MEDTALQTVTHARLRALQGDPAGAVRILEAVLARRPEDAAARELLRNLPRGRAREAEGDEAPVAPPTAASADELARTFRRTLAPPPTPARSRLQRFLAAITRHAR
jgi:hypothetical protein